MTIRLMLFCCAVTLLSCQPQEHHSNDFVTSDVDNFWIAYDKIIRTQDSTEQLQYLKEDFLDKATPGQLAMIAARRYTPEQYLYAINNYPAFWASIRPNTQKARQLADEIAAGVAQLRELYPEMRPVKVYFTMGVFRSPGTTMDSMVLIGTELALGDVNTVAHEFPKEMDYVRDYYQTNPIENIAFLNVHEFVHTQQREHEFVLLKRTAYEGVAEFVAEKATGEVSTSPALAYGPSNDERIKEVFIPQMCSPITVYNWLYNSKENEFETRDLGYYVGYAICEQYYEKAADKALAIKQMIEMDFDDEAAFFAFVDEAGYFPRPVKEYKTAFEAKRPEVQRMAPFDNGTQGVDPSIQQVTFHFSSPMDVRFKSTDYGTLGEEACPKINGASFAPDSLSVAYDIALEPNTRYQMVINYGYRTPEGIPLKPYLVEFWTGE
jgi:hypothetical protein